MEEHVFKRKLYDRMLQWKNEEQGKTAILIEGARRVGKSTLVRQFAQNEYKSHLIIDFSKAKAEIKSLFDDLSNRELCTSLQKAINKVLTKREKKVIALRYGIGGNPPLTQRQTADACGISRSYVSRIEKKALKKLEDALQD